MKKTFRKMVTIMSAMVIAAGCFINLMSAPKAEAAEASASTTIDAEKIAEEMAAKFNNARAELGLEPLYIVPELNKVAEVRASEIASSNESYSHTRPDGTSFTTAIDASSLNCENAGEILLRGSANTNTIFNAWKKSAGHWAIITKPEATHIGISAHFDPDSEKRWYWAAEIVTFPEGYEAEGQKLPLEEVIPDTTPKTFEENDNIAEDKNEVICGDINADGIVDSFDLILMNRYLNGKMEFTSAQIAAADMLKDGAVTEIDAGILRMYLLGEISILPAA